MTMKMLSRSAGALLLASCLITSGVTAQTTRAEGDYSMLVEQREPHMVTVKYLLKLSGMGGEQEIENEISGLIISEDGLVLVSNSELDPTAMMPGMGASAIPRDIRVLIGDDTEGLDAELLARDTELDFAWIKLDDEPAEELPFLDLQGATGEADLGDSVMLLQRLPRYFDRATTVTAARIGGKTSKPRDLLILDGLPAGPGTAVYDAGGRPIGLVVMQQGEGSAMSMSSMIMNSLRIFVLPLSEVQVATDRAMESVEVEE